MKIPIYYLWSNRHHKSQIIKNGNIENLRFLSVQGYGPDLSKYTCNHFFLLVRPCPRNKIL